MVSLLVSHHIQRFVQLGHELQDSFLVFDLVAPVLDNVIDSRFLGIFSRCSPDDYPAVVFLVGDCRGCLTDRYQ